MFVGPVDDYWLPAYYAATDVVILPSTSRLEAFGIVELELSESDYYGSAPDMGAFELDSMVGDLNNDLTVNIQDIVLMVNLILSNGYDSSADLNSDGLLNVLDVVGLVNLILE